LWLSAVALSSIVGGLVLVFSKDLDSPAESGRVMKKWFDQKLTS